MSMNQQMMQLAMMKVQNTPELANSPMGQSFLQIMQSGNQQAGIEMANNIINTLGISRDQAIQQAMNGLGRMNFR